MNRTIERRGARPAARRLEAPGKARRDPGRRHGREEIILGPQAGPQMAFCKCTAEILIYGGAAGGGKSWALLYDPLRYVSIPGFEAVIFRRSYPELKMAGGLWDESNKIYNLLGAESNITDRTWEWKAGGKITFRSLQYEDTVYEYQGAQIAYIGIDELTHFTEKQFFYMLSRNRSTCGVTPHVRATTNPSADSWVRKLISYWLDKDGFAIPARSGEIRYIVRTDQGEIKNFASRAEAEAFATPNGLGVKSITFINAKLSDNPILQEKDPNYEMNLNLQDKVERERLKNGNWNIRYEGGKVFQKRYFQIVNAPPAGLRQVRYWDLAASEGEGDYTVGLLMGTDGMAWYILDIVRGQWSPGGVRAEIMRAASRDGEGIEIWIEQEGGASGKFAASQLIGGLAGYMAFADKKSGSKLESAKPLSAQAEAGNIKLVRAEWNEAFINEMVSFAGDNKGHDDQVDAAAGAFSKLAQPQGSVRFL